MSEDLLGIKVEFPFLTKQNTAQRFYLKDELIGLNVILFVIFFLDQNSASPQWALWVNSIPVREASRALWLERHIPSQVLSSESSFLLTPLIGGQKEAVARGSSPLALLHVRCSLPGWGKATSPTHHSASGLTWLLERPPVPWSKTKLIPQPPPVFPPLCSLLLSLPTHSFIHSFNK